jgi:hypothetical protein
MKRDQLSGTDPLTVFIMRTREHSQTVSEELPESYALLTQVATLYREVIDYMARPSVGPTDESHRQGIKLFFNRSNGAFLLAAQTALSGLVPDTCGITRACLEAAAYGHFVASDGSNLTLWQNRGNSEDDKRAFRKQFTWVNVSQAVRHRDSLAADTLEAQYEKTIDYGGHPNRGAIAPFISYTESARCYDVITDSRQHLLTATHFVCSCGMQAIFLALLTFDETRAMFEPRWELLMERILEYRRQAVHSSPIESDSSHDVT